MKRPTIQTTKKKPTPPQDPPLRPGRKPTVHAEIPVTVKLDRSLAERLHELSQTTRVSMSSYVREGIEVVLRRYAERQVFAEV